MSKKQYTVEIFSLGGKLVKWRYEDKERRDKIYDTIRIDLANGKLRVIEDTNSMIPLHAIDYIIRGEQYGE